MSIQRNLNTIKQVFHSKAIRTIFRFVCIYSFFIFMHTLSANLYTDFCAKNSIKGMLYSLFVVPSPHCAVLRNMMDLGVNGIYWFWSIVFFHLTAVISKIGTR